MSDGDEHLVFASAKASGEGLVAGLGDDACAYPVPELLLSNPVFFAVVADDEGGLFYVHKVYGEKSQVDGLDFGMRAMITTRRDAHCFTSRLIEV